MGLRNGDYLMTVNDIDVLHMSHEDIVELIQRTVGPLRLRCLENDSNFSSNTDDTDVESDGRHSRQHTINERPLPQTTQRHRNRYGNRHRKGLLSNKCYSTENLSSNMMSSEYNRVVERNPLETNPFLTQNSHNHFHYHQNSRPQSKTTSRYRPISVMSKTNEPILDLLLEQKLSKIRSNLSESDSNNSNKTNSLNNNNKHKNSYERSAKISSNESKCDSELHQKRGQSLENIINPSIDTHLNVSDFKLFDQDTFLLLN